MDKKDKCGDVFHGSYRIKQDNGSFKLYGIPKPTDSYPKCLVKASSPEKCEECYYYQLSKINNQPKTS